jgi:uncharacterized protein (TIGR02679 family)
MSDGGPRRERPVLAPSLLDRARLPDLAPLWDEFARRVGASDRPVRAVRLTELTPAQQEALADLLAWPRLPGASVRVEVGALAAAFGTDPEGLRALLEALRGPLPDRASAREQASLDRQRLWEEVAAAVSGRGLQPWVARLRAAGVPDGEVEAHRRRLRPLLSLVQQLPLRPPEPLPIVAQSLTGDPHAFDQGWLRTMLADAAATLIGLGTPTDAESTRAALRGVGIVPDQLSVPVVCVGLRAAGSDPVARYLDGLGVAHEPAALTAAQLRRWPVAVGHDRVWVVENPSVLERIARCELDVPVVCTSSWPTDAVVVLLDQVRASGASLHYHSDLDGAGLALTGHLIRRFGATPWRMSVDDYLAAVDGARMPLMVDGPLPETPWDPALREAMLEHRRVVYEEQVVDTLLGDLRAP